jgi:acid phosphatase
MFGLYPSHPASQAPEDIRPVNQCVEYVRQRREEVGDFATRCSWEGDAGHATFLHQD